MRDVLESEEMSCRFSVGISRPSHLYKLSDRDDIVQSMANHFSISSVKAELDQLTEGLKVLDVLNLFREYPNSMRPLLLYSKPIRLTSDYIIDIFKPMLSLPGSNVREREEAILLQWTNYVQLIEGKTIFLHCVYVCVDIPIIIKLLKKFQIKMEVSMGLLQMEKL